MMQVPAYSSYDKDKGHGNTLTRLFLRRCFDINDWATRVIFLLTFASSPSSAAT